MTGKAQQAIVMCLFAAAVSAVAAAAGDMELMGPTYLVVLLQMKEGGCLPNEIHLQDTLVRVSSRVFQ